MPDDHSEVVPLLPIPNRTVKRFCADDSADSRVKVGHRQAIKPETLSRKIERFSKSSKRIFGKTQKRARIQGFADHGEARRKWDESPAAEEIIKNIQPISVGV